MKRENPDSRHGSPGHGFMVDINKIKYSAVLTQHASEV